MLYCVKGVGKVKLQEYNFSLRSLTLMNILEGPGQAVMNGSPTEETILVLMHQAENNFLEAIGQYFSDQFEAAVQERYGPKIIDRVR